jgi:branched-chain amino acid transport system ATP-binding protein
MRALEIQGLTKAFGGLKVTRDVNLSVEPGERRLVIGPNGAGKTTLFNLITGELWPDAGRMSMFGQALDDLPAWRRAHLGLARTYQIITLFPKASLAHNVCLSVLGLSSVRWRPWGPLGREQAFDARARETLSQVELAHLAGRRVSETSYGEQRRTEIAMALAQRPRLLLLDEPFAGLSLDERNDVRQLLARIPREVTVVMIEHDMDVALELADRITLMHFGEVVVEGTRDEVVAHPRTREIYLGA